MALQEFWVVQYTPTARCVKPRKFVNGVSTAQHIIVVQELLYFYGLGRPQLLLLEGEDPVDAELQVGGIVRRTPDGHYILVGNGHGNSACCSLEACLESCCKEYGTSRLVPRAQSWTCSLSRRRPRGATSQNGMQELLRSSLSPAGGAHAQRVLVFLRTRCARQVSNKLAKMFAKMSAPCVVASRSWPGPRHVGVK